VAFSPYQTKAAATKGKNSSFCSPPPYSKHRCVFPIPVVTLEGLQPHREYDLSLRVAPADVFYYKYHPDCSQWNPASLSDVTRKQAKQVYRHPSSPRKGSFWMRHPVSFKDMKITNNPNSNHKMPSPYITVVQC